MGTSVVCPSCSTLTDGSASKCQTCGAALAGATADGAASQKICSVCKVDISRQRRLRDNAGHYFCTACWQAKAAGKSAQSTTSNYQCVSCGHFFGLDQVYDDNGAIICAKCWEKKSAEPAGSARGAATTQVGDRPPQLTRRKSEPAGPVPLEADDLGPSDPYALAGDAPVTPAAAVPPVSFGAPAPGAFVPGGTGAHLLACTDCRQGFTYDQLQNVDGVPLCRKCLKARGKLDAKSARVKQKEQDRINATMRGHNRPVATGSTGSGRGRSAGIIFVVIGLGGVVLHFSGSEYQFKLLIPFGNAAPIAGVVVAILGAILFFSGC